MFRDSTQNFVRLAINYEEISKEITPSKLLIMATLILIRISIVCGTKQPFKILKGMKMKFEEMKLMNE
jgi:hypothetical protein